MAGATGRQAEKRRRTRARLLEAACRLMSEKGVDATTIQEITEAADVGFGTFYNYFQSKDEVATQVLDCVISNLGRRNDLVTAALGLTDPVAIVATSVRLVAREMLTNPVWVWWVKRPDLVVERMRAGFEPFGLRDMDRAVAAGAYRLAGGDRRTAWTYLIWLLAGASKDIIDGVSPPQSERLMGEAIMRVMGVAPDKARVAAELDLPPYPDLPIDFTFVLGEAGLA